MPGSLRKLPVLQCSPCEPPVPGSWGHVTHEARAPEHSAFNTETGFAGVGRETGAQGSPLPGFECPLCWPVTSDKAQMPRMPASSFVKEGRGPPRPMEKIEQMPYKTTHPVFTHSRAATMQNRRQAALTHLRLHASEGTHFPEQGVGVQTFSLSEIGMPVASSLWVLGAPGRLTMSRFVPDTRDREKDGCYAVKLAGRSLN